jgi:hypothetical protein
VTPFFVHEVCQNVEVAPSRQKKERISFVLRPTFRIFATESRDARSNMTITIKN